MNGMNGAGAGPGIGPQLAKVLVNIGVVQRLNGVVLINWIGCIIGSGVAGIGIVVVTINGGGVMP
jgi:hypothetical protein